MKILIYNVILSQANVSRDEG